MSVRFAAIAAALTACLAAACASPTATPTAEPAPTAAPAPASTPPPAPPANLPALAGEIAFAGDPAVPPGAVVEAQLRDVSLQDAASVLIASQTIEGAERFPVPFAIRYDPAKIDERRDYAVQVSITVGGELVYVNDAAFGALTRGYPSDNLAVEVVRAQ